MAFSLFSRKKPFTHDFFKDWIKTLTETCIPSLQGSASTAAYSSTQSIDVSLVHRYFVSYYEFLNNTADTKTISHLLFSSLRNSFETPFLFLGDIHPSILTNLVRSLIFQGNLDADVNPSEFGFTDLDHPWTKTRSWKDPSEALLKTLEDLEQEMKQSVLALHDRVGQAQLRLVNRVSARWVQSNYGKDGRNEQTVLDTSSSVAVDDAALEDMMELVSIFVDANRLRMKVITGLVKLMNDSQAAQYLESLCKFFPGFTL